MTNQVRPASSCVANVIYPWSQLTVPDNNFNASNGFPPRKVYVEAVDYLPGLAGESRNFDANGPYIRVLLNGGTFTYSLSPGLFGQSLEQLEGAQPTAPPGGQRPPYEPRRSRVRRRRRSPTSPRRRAPPLQQINTRRCRRSRSAKRNAEIKQALSAVESSAKADRPQGQRPQDLP